MQGRRLVLQFNDGSLWLFRDKDGQALLVAGAAAGVSAVFQAPATGVLFALESPYKGDLGRRRYSQRCCRALRVM